jgi:hypothetical protein
MANHLHSQLHFNPSVTAKLVVSSLGMLCSVLQILNLSLVSDCLT